MQQGEGIVDLIKFMEEDKKNECEYKPDGIEWKANLKGKGKNLGDNLGNKPHFTRCVKKLSETTYPSQAHHLIPNARLNPEAKGAEDNPPHLAHQLLISGGYLYGDTDYDINHENNGKWMPYASALLGWIKKKDIKCDEDTKKNKNLIRDVMRETKIQLHQGGHSYKKFGVGEAGYLERVDQYLDKIKNNALSHFIGDSKCDECSNKDDLLYPPRKNTIRYFDEASRLIKIDINKCRIFVSSITAEIHQDPEPHQGIGFIMENNA